MAAVDKVLISSVLFDEGLLFSILNFCDDRTRSNFIYISGQFNNFLTSEASFKWRSKRLHVEKGVYHSPYPPPDATWKSVFLNNWTRRNLWEGSNHQLNNDRDSDAQFELTVAARFKPKGVIVNQATGKNDENVKKIALPLHQRLALIRANNNISSQKEAFEVLTHQGGWFGDEQEHLDRKESREDRNSDDDRERHSSALSMTGGVRIVDCENSFAILVDRTKGLRQFNFDHVFGDIDGQKDVYDTTAMPLIADFINGYNATCLVYGQTGSGKTYSMFGPDAHEASLSADEPVVSPHGKPPKSWGIVPRSCAEIFQALDYRRQELGIDVNSDIGISYIEVYGESVTDLLRKGAGCGKSKVVAQRYVLDGSSEVPVTSLKEALELLDQGEKQKRKAATVINERSSRAHTLFIATLRQECPDTGVQIENRLFLADLGGSEQIKKSQPFKSDNKEALADEKQRVREAVNINLGLLALKQCVESLRRKKHVPYADSKLTMMLSTGLGGSSKTAVIVCGAQEAIHGPETIAAMKFGQTCRGVKNTVNSNATMLHSLLNRINSQISECEQHILNNERWEEVDVKQYDDESGELIEIRKKTVVVGAEEYRYELANLIHQKAELTGEDIEDLYGGSSSVIQGFGDFKKYTGVDASQELPGH